MGRKIIRGLVFITVLLTALWGTLALWYQLPQEGAWRHIFLGGWGILVSASLTWVVLSPKLRPPFFYIIAFVILLIWWAGIMPSNDRLWADDVAEMTTGEVEGGIVTLKNVRNFDWKTQVNYVQRWETRSYDLTKLETVDLFLSYWTGPQIAHTLVSFGFEDGEHVVFSVEIRKESHEKFSEIGGFFKEFETSVIAADERDIIRLRSNVRYEDVYRYRVNMPKDKARELFLAYVEEANELAVKPRFYNTITANCTTIVYHMVSKIIPKLPMSYTLLLSGYLPEYINSIGGFGKDVDLEELRAKGRIRDRAIEADQSPKFSQLIRAEQTN